MSWMQSWERQILAHVNRVVTLYQDGDVVAINALIINIDLENGRIVYRKEEGEGPQVTLWGGSIRIEDKHNYRPGKSEYEKMHGIERSPEELIRAY